MFGYIRPVKAELKMREFTRYRSVYCGICKAIGRTYGQLPRLGVSYDLTFLGLLMQAVAEPDPVLTTERCVLHAVRPRVVTAADDCLLACADYTVLLTLLKLADNVADRDHALSARAALAWLGRARRQANRRCPVLKPRLETEMAAFNAAEAQGCFDEAADRFGALLGLIFEAAAAVAKLEPMYADALRLAGRDLGRWVYRIDAADDWRKDRASGRRNAYGSLTDRAAVAQQAERDLIPLEQSLDRSLALLPYRRDAAIVQNIVQLGLSETRQTVLSGGTLDRI